MSGSSESFVQVTTAPRKQAQPLRVRRGATARRPHSPRRRARDLVKRATMEVQPANLPSLVLVRVSLSCCNLFCGVWNLVHVSILYLLSGRPPHLLCSALRSVIVSVLCDSRFHVFVATACPSAHCMRDVLCSLCFLRTLPLVCSLHRSLPSTFLHDLGNVSFLDVP